MTATPLNARPAWDDYWPTIGSEDYLAAKALLDLSPQVRGDAALWLKWDSYEQWNDDGEVIGHSTPFATLDWDGWIENIDQHGVGWSSTEKRLFEVIAALVSTEPREIALRGILDYMGSWEVDVWRILVNWGTGGNNQDRRGRATVTQ